MTEQQKVKSYLDKFQSISSLEATVHLGITQFHRCLKDMKNAGMKLDDYWVTKENGTKHYKRYFLV